MAEVTVFVDDAVTGRLPDVCALDGVPAPGRTRLSIRIDDGARLGVAWLLVLAGPLGWIALAVLALARNGRAEVLRVALPLSDDAHRRHVATRRARDLFGLLAPVVAVALVVLVLATANRPWASLALVAAAGVAALVVVQWVAAERRASRSTVRISLDASRRWVTLSNVHPAFADACRHHQASRPR